MVDYVDMKLVSQEGNPKITYDLSDYGMDILAADGQVFLPLSTLSDILAQSLTFSDYIDGEIYLVRADSSGSDYTSHTQDKVNAYFETLTREADVASYAYNELCFVLDNLYGRPERAQSQEFVNSLATIGLDETLEKGGTLNGIDLKKMKTYLTSTNKAEYAQGLVMLDNLLFDGGHTLFSSPYIFRFLADENLDRTELSRGYKVILDEDPDAKNTANHFLDLFENVLVTGNELRSLRQEGFGTASKIWENDNGEEISSIYLFDNTAIFRFDEFKDDVIRTSSGTRPLQEALEYAKENNCDNFVLDLSTNGGGSDQTMGYILSMIFEEDAVFYHYDVNTGARRVEVFTADKNLDGTKDEKDAEVKYGFHYAVMMSRYTYSCGNFASILAKEHGIPLLGENSGGGGCLVTMHGFPDECDSYQISSSIGMSDSSNQSADSGASPDYPMAVYPEDGGDMPSLYDPAEIVDIVNGHYQ